MTANRWQEVMNDPAERLTDQEVAAGWHFCRELDGLLVNPNEERLEFCHCLDGTGIRVVMPPAKAGQEVVF